jgi:hypothetical protein
MKIEIALGRIFLVLLCVVLTFWVLDAVSLKFISSRSPIERRYPLQVVRHPEPYTMFGGQVNTAGLNRLGYRGNAPVNPKDSNEYRIFILGGSTVFLGNPPIAILLEQEFKKNGYQNVRVYNFGVISSVSGMELSRIVFQISEFEPDLIIMYNGGNDMLHPWSWDPRPGYPFNFIVYERNPLLESDVRHYPALALFAYGSNIARSLFPDYFKNKFVQLHQARVKVQWGSKEWANEIAKIYVDNLIKADKISRVFEADFLVFFQPLVYYKHTLSPGENQFFDPAEKNFVIYTRKKIFSKIEEISEDSRINIVDLSQIFENTPERVFLDTIHIQQEKKGVVALEMYNRIIKDYEMKKTTAISESPNI